MLQSFLLIDEFVSNSSSPRPGSSTGNCPAEETLKDMGFRVQVISSSKELPIIVSKVDAVILSVPTERVEPWRTRVLELKSLPVLWWCDPLTFPSHACKMDPGIDGMMGPGMNTLEIHCALLLSVNHYFQRTQWLQEREQLLSKIEERKWIDQAKRILSEIKHISEAEAYEFLRKQAMNERKRMSDVAASIVKVYQLLQDENKGGRRR